MRGETQTWPESIGTPAKIKKNRGIPNKILRSAKQTKQFPPQVLRSAARTSSRKSRRRPFFTPIRSSKEYRPGVTARWVLQKRHQSSPHTRHTKEKSNNNNDRAREKDERKVTTHVYRCTRTHLHSTYRPAGLGVPAGVLHSRSGGSTPIASPKYRQEGCGCRTDGDNSHRPGCAGITFWVPKGLGPQYLRLVATRAKQNQTRHA